MKCVTPMIMTYLIHGRPVIDIKATRIEHAVIAADMLVIRVISGKYFDAGNELTNESKNEVFLGSHFEFDPAEDGEIILSA